MWVLIFMRWFLMVRIGVVTASSCFWKGYIEANATYLANHGQHMKDNLWGFLLTLLWTMSGQSSFSLFTLLCSGVCVGRGTLW